MSQFDSCSREPEWSSTRCYLHMAIDLLETFVNSGYEPESLPLDCREPNWMFPNNVYNELSYWTLTEGRSVLVVGLQAPEVFMVGWMFNMAGIQFTHLYDVRFTNDQFQMLMQVCAQLRNVRIVIEPGPVADVSSFSQIVHYANLEFGVDRVLANPALSEGGDLRHEPEKIDWPGERLVFVDS